jgi:hypothetical protein
VNCSCDRPSGGADRTLEIPSSSAESGGASTPPALIQFQAFPADWIDEIDLTMPDGFADDERAMEIFGANPADRNWTHVLEELIWVASASGGSGDHLGVDYGFDDGVTDVPTSLEITALIQRLGDAS